MGWRRKRNRSGRVRCLVGVLAVATALGGPASADEAPVRQRRMLVCGKQTAIVAFSREYPEGVVEWNDPVNTREGWVLPDGGILAALTNGNRVVEFDADGKIRWQVTAAETDGAINDACGVQRLPNGNTMIASYRIGKGQERLLEVSPAKEIVWAWKANVPAVHHFHVLEIGDTPTPFPSLR